MSKQTKGLISIILFLICIGTCILTYRSSEYIKNWQALLYSCIISVSGFLFLYTTFNTFMTAKIDKE